MPAGRRGGSGRKKGLIALVAVLAVVLVGVGGIWAWQKIQWARADTGDLIAYLADSDAAKRAEAHRRLVDKGEAAVAPLRAALDGGAAGQRTEVVLALLGIGSPQALAATVDALGDPATQVAGAAEAGLLRAGKSAEPALIAGLAAPKPAVRATAARLLGETGDKAVAAPLVEALSDESSGVRVAAADALGALGDARAAAGPLAHALSDRSTEVRVAAAEAIGTLRIKSAAGKLVSLFGSSDAQVRKAAIRALEMLGKAAAAGPVSAALRDHSAKVRAVAAKECGVMRIKESAPRLTGLLKDKNQRVRWAAQNALVRLGAAAVEPLSSQLGSGAGSIKWVAATILVRIARSDPDAVKPLLDLLHNGSVGGVAERYAFFIRLGHPGSEGVLIKALDGYGDTTMCVDYLNCGNDKLDRAARNWANRHGYYVTTSYGSSHGGPMWGEGT